VEIHEEIDTLRETLAKFVGGNSGCSGTWQEKGVCSSA